MNFGMEMLAMRMDMPALTIPRLPNVEMVQPRHKDSHRLAQTQHDFRIVQSQEAGVSLIYLVCLQLEYLRWFVV